MVLIEFTDKFIRLAKASVNKSELRVHISLLKTYGLQKGVITDGRIEKPAIILNIIKDFKESAKIDEDVASICIDSPHIQFDEIEIPYSASVLDQKTIEERIRSAIEEDEDEYVFYSVFENECIACSPSTLIKTSICPKDLALKYKLTMDCLGLELQGIYFLGGEDENIIPYKCDFAYGVNSSDCNNLFRAIYANRKCISFFASSFWDGEFAGKRRKLTIDRAAKILSKGILYVAIFIVFAAMIGFAICN